MFPIRNRARSIYQQWQDRSRERRPDAELTDAQSGSDAAIAEARIGALGSGSDYTPFLQHLGIPASDMGFGGDYGVYHSAYDSFYWMSHFGDPTFAYHVTAARIWGLVAMRLAGAEGLPLDYRDYATQINEFFEESMKTAKRRNLASAFDEKPMRDAIRKFSEEAARTEKARAGCDQAESSGARNNAKLRRLNDELIAVERALTDSRGLRGRTWYRHQIYAPGNLYGLCGSAAP